MLKKLGRASVIAAMAAVTGLGLTQAADAASVDLAYGGIEAQVDDNPGNGAAAWVWVYASSGHAGGVQYEFYDGNTASLSVGDGQSTAKSLAADVWRFQIFVFDRYGHASYTAWKYA
jgi:hypothetical protein